MSRNALTATSSGTSPTSPRMYYAVGIAEQAVHRLSGDARIVTLNYLILFGWALSRSFLPGAPREGS